VKSLLIAVVLATAGCSALPVAGAAGAGGAATWVATAQTDVKVADDILAGDAPVKQVWCALHLHDQRSPGAQYVVTTYCANIPTTVLDAVALWGEILAGAP
jgi:hypothetical protein